MTNDLVNHRNGVYDTIAAEELDGFQHSSLYLGNNVVGPNCVVADREYTAKGLAWSDSDKPLEYIGHINHVLFDTIINQHQVFISSKFEVFLG